jgi:hypothetical protein
MKTNLLQFGCGSDFFSGCGPLSTKSFNKPKVKNNYRSLNAPLSTKNKALTSLSTQSRNYESQTIKTNYNCG